MLRILFFLLITTQAFAQPINTPLKKQLDSIAIEDQRYRELITNMSAQQEDSLAAHFHIPAESVRSHIITLQEGIDKQALASVSEIIKQYGYPGISLVGKPTNEVAFYVIQHSDRIAEYIGLLKKAAQKKQIPFTSYAMMLDRYLVESRKEQVYGTQLWGMPKEDSAGHVSIEWYFAPIKDVSSVNQRRRKAGFKETIEEYAKEYEIPFRMRQQPYE